MKMAVKAGILAIASAYTFQVQAEITTAFVDGKNPATGDLIYTITNKRVTLKTREFTRAASITSDTGMGTLSGQFKLIINGIAKDPDWFNPRTWSGGTPSAISTQDQGWGIDSKLDINANMQRGEAILLTFDLNGLQPLGKGESFVWSGVDLGYKSAQIWKKNGALDEGILVNSGEFLTGHIPLSDGDTFALVNNKETGPMRLKEMKINVIRVPKKSVILGLITD